MSDSLNGVGVAEGVGVASSGAREAVAVGVAEGVSVDVAVAVSEGVGDEEGVAVADGWGVGDSLDGVGVAEGVGVASSGAGEGVALRVAGGDSVDVAVAVSEGDDAGAAAIAGADWVRGAASVGAIGDSVIEVVVPDGEPAAARPGSSGATGCIRASGGATSLAEFPASSSDGLGLGELSSSVGELSAACDGAALGFCSSSASAITW